MKQLLIINSILLLSFCYGQSNNFDVGSKWNYEHSMIRDSSYWESKYARDMDSIYPVEIHEIQYFEGLAKVVYNEQVGFIDSNKKIVIPLIYEYGLGANRFSNSKSIVIKDGYWGVIDTLGNEVIPFKFGKIRDRDSLYCVYEYDGYKWGIMDLFGNIILPMREYNTSSILTLDKINELARKYDKKDSLENSVAISKEKAINIAKRKKYWIENSEMFIPSVELNLDSKEWIIRSTKSNGVTRKGKCAHTNGCIVQIRYLIVIDSNNGKVKRKSKNKVLIPVYE